MQVKELFISNETYPLPLDQYPHYKSRVTKCSGNPMCLNNVKYDVETFIADFGRKNGSKLENGDESGFVTIKDDVAPAVVAKTDEENKTVPIITWVLLALIIIAFWYAIKKKNPLVAIIAIAVAAVVAGPLVSKNKFKFSMNS